MAFIIYFLVVLLLAYLLITVGGGSKLGTSTAADPSKRKADTSCQISAVTLTQIIMAGT